uniref:Uncharacterized protein n=1 Tax=Alexandrium monilatum TaxID=311494 RepID=A0A7S4S0B0_9DINO
MAVAARKSSSGPCCRSLAHNGAYGRSRGTEGQRHQRLHLGLLQTQCWAEKGMASRTKLDDWVSSFLPPPCTRVYFINNHPSDPVVKCDDLPLATRTAYGSPPCVGELYRVTLHGYTGTWLIRLDRSREGKCSLGCLHTGACRRSKKNGYAVFDGPGTQCGVA